VQIRSNLLEVRSRPKHLEKENPEAEETTQPHGKAFVRKEGKKMNTSMEKPHLSYSQINMYLTCPLKYKYHYIDHIEPPFVSSALVFGSCIHEAVGAFYQSCLEGDPLSPSQVHDVYRQSWESHSKE